jgi:hypothetical protein
MGKVGDIIHKDKGIRLAVMVCGSYTELCARLKMSSGAVHRWKKVPAKRLVQVEKVTGIDRSILRPDLCRPNNRKS